MRRLLLLVGAIVFVDTMFFAALTPLLPRLSDEFGLSKTQAGILAGAYPAGALLGGIPSGLATARFGPRPTAVAGLTLLTATTLAFGVADSLWLLDAARFAQGFASSLAWTAGLTWLVAAAPSDRRGELIGLAMAAAIVGALCGPVLGGLASVTGRAAAFGGVGAVALALAAWARATPAPARPPEIQPLRRLFAALGDLGVAGAIWFVTLPALLFGTVGVLAPLRLSELGVGAVGISAVYLLSAALEAVLSPLTGRVSDRRGRFLPLRVGLAGAVAVLLLLPWPNASYGLAALVVLAGLAFGTFWTPAMSLLADRAEQRGLEYAYAFALVNLAWAPGQALGAAGSGALADVTSDAVPYLLLAAVCATTLALTWRGAEAPAPHAA